MGATIVAISTPPGPARRGILRLSGEDAHDLALGRFSTRSLHARVRRGVLSVGQRKSVPCPATVWLSRAPRTYTGEDTAELHLPGAPALLDMVLSELIARGATPAEPGEFTRRAFLNGRIDLTRAEAVLALIHAQSDEDRRAALVLLNGGLAEALAALRDRILTVLVPIEVSLDFSDQDAREVLPKGLRKTLERLGQDVRELALGTAEKGVANLRPRVVLTGPANAGKSSLFNRLTGHDHAIVTPIAGTTRDVLTADLKLGPVTVSLADTAGDDVDAALADEVAHRHRQRRLEGADVVVHVRSLLAPLERAQRALEPGQCKVYTHADLAPHAVIPEDGVAVSNVTGVGFDALVTHLADALAASRSEASSGQTLVNARHSGGLFAVARCLDSAVEAHRDRVGLELVASDLHGALAGLAELTGEDATQDVLDRIFGGFCIGK